jgi:hypothetical protein
MDITISKAAMSHNKEEGYLGHVEFLVQEHPKAYEITLQSKNDRDWNYSLIFAGEPGKEEHILQVEEQLEQDDDLFDQLVAAARSCVPE